MTTLEERVAQAIAFTLAINTDLPDWMQTPALGRDMLPLGELAAPAVVALVGEVLGDLQGRLVTANMLLSQGFDHAGAEHVRLALSYLDEAVRKAGR